MEEAAEAREELPELPRLMGRISLRLEPEPEAKASEEDRAVYLRALEAERERQTAWRQWIRHGKAPGAKNFN